VPAGSGVVAPPIFPLAVLGAQRRCTATLSQVRVPLLLHIVRSLCGPESCSAHFREEKQFFIVCWELNHDSLVAHH
jgi:hypothetical protein